MPQVPNLFQPDPAARQMELADMLDEFNFQPPNNLAHLPPAPLFQGPAILDPRTGSPVFVPPGFTSSNPLMQFLSPMAQTPQDTAAASMVLSNIFGAGSAPETPAAPAVPDNTLAMISQLLQQQQSQQQPDQQQFAAPQFTQPQLPTVQQPAAQPATPATSQIDPNLLAALQQATAGNDSATLSLLAALSNDLDQPRRRRDEMFLPQQSYQDPAEWYRRRQMGA